METKQGGFVYRRQYVRYAVALFILIFEPLQLSIAWYLPKVYLFGAIGFTSLLFIGAYFFCTRRFFLRKGSYRLDQDMLNLYLVHKKFEIPLRSILDCSCQKKRFLGEEYYVLTIKTESKVLKLFSENLAIKNLTNEHPANEKNRRELHILYTLPVYP